MIEIRPGLRLALVVLAEFFIAMGTAVAGAMAQSGQIVWPVPAVYALGAILGSVAAWKELKANLRPAGPSS